MPKAPQRPCRHHNPPCGALTDHRSGFCLAHQKAYHLARASSHARGYTAEWADYSRRWLQRFPWCGQRADGRQHRQHSRCTQQGLQVRATATDHIRSMRAGGAALDPRNHQSLCSACNSRKNVRHEGGFGREPQPLPLKDQP